MPTQDRVPTGSGFVIQWTPLSGNNWANVDDPVGTPDEDATYNSTALFYKADSFTFSAFSIDSSAITKLTHTMRVKASGASSWYGMAILRVNGTTYYGANKTYTTSYVNYTTDWLTNPNTGLAWIEADIEGTGPAPLQEFGYRSDEPSVTLTTTQCYVTVDYTAAGGLSIPVILKIRPNTLLRM